MSARLALRRSLERGLVIFTGAGVSLESPSFLPVVRPLLHIAAERTLASARLPSPLDAEVSSVYRYFHASLPLEHLMDILHQACGDEALALLDIYRRTAPNRNHAVAAFARTLQPSTTIVTLNFDTLHEDALARFAGLHAVSIATDDEFGAARHLPPSSVPVFHLHGAVLGVGAAGLAVSISTTRTGLLPKRAAFLRQALTNADVFCVGYSNADIDTYPLIEATPRQLFWYAHENVPPAVERSAPGRLGSRFHVITRDSSEATFSDVLENVWPEVGALRAAHWELPATLPDDVSIRLASFQSRFDELLMASLSPARAACYILASIADVSGARELALKLVAAGRTHAAATDRLAEAEEALIGHIYARAGDSAAALRSYARLRRRASDEVSRAVAEVLAGSESLGLWKRFPLDLWHLLRWWVPVHRLQHSAIEPARQLALYERADFFHFVAEQLLMPSGYAALLPRRIARLLHPVMSQLDRLAMRLPLRRHCLRLAAREYIGLIRLATQMTLDAYVGYTVLARLRLIECLAALGHVRLIDTARHLAEAERFYVWTNTLHGIGNVHCAAAIVAISASDSSAAKDALNKAEAAYGTHRSGRRKARLIRYRLPL